MKKFMNKNVLTSLCLASLIALLPSCGCSKNETECVGGVCPVASHVVEDEKAIDTDSSAVQEAPAAEMSSMEDAAPEAVKTVEEKADNA